LVQIDPYFFLFVSLAGMLHREYEFFKQILGSPLTKSDGSLLVGLLWRLDLELP